MLGSVATLPTNSEVENSGYSAGWLLPFRRPKSSRSSGQSRLPNLGEICSIDSWSFCPRSHDLFSHSFEAEISSSLTGWFRQLSLMQSTRLMRVASRVVSYRRPSPISNRVGRRSQSRSVRQSHPCSRWSKQTPISTLYEAAGTPKYITFLM